MKRRALLTLLAFGIATGGQAMADEPVQRILRDLKKLGYHNVSVETTLLRRTRIVAESDDAQREIIVNPNTGEILRDLWIPIKTSASGDESGGILGDDSGSGSGDDNGGGDNSGHGGGDDGGGDDGGGDDGGGSDDGGGDDHGGNSGSGGNGSSGGSGKGGGDDG